MDLTGKKVLVFGSGKSGTGAADLLGQVGACPVIYDGNPEIDKEAVVHKISHVKNVEVYAGELPEEVRKSLDLVVLSPGVPTDLPLVRSFYGQGLPVWGEVELAYRTGKGRVLAITGTNGKTTTTALLGKIMSDAEDSVFVVGNIGTPYTSKALEMKETSVTVAEISSFQLETIDRFAPEVSAILNITEDHLNRHHTMEEYIRVKELIIKNQKPENYCVLNYEDEVLREFGRDIVPETVYFSSVRKLEKGIYLDNGVIVLKTEKEEIPEILSVSKLEADIEKSFNRARSMDETALIVYTSGTTGNPKGVMISFGNICSQMRDFEKIFKLSKDNTLLSILPLNHLLELNVGFFGMLFMGAKIVYIKTLNPKELSAAMKDKQITNMIVVPLVAKMLKNSVDKQLKKQPEHVQKIFKFMYAAAKYMPRFVRRIMFKSIIDGFGGKFECFISGGAPLDAEIAEFFERIGAPAFEGYGLTETSPVISTNRYDAHKIGTVGKPLPSVKVKLSEQGELLATGPNVMQGYYNKPEMTAEVIDEDGWFHTGDIAEIDKDGFIKITGRIKNMIVLGGGKKIFPEEVEAVLEQSPLIKELCVLSLKIQSGNKAGTEEVGVIIVPSDELAQKSDEEIQKELEAEVKKLSEANLAAYKAPSVVVFRREDLPKTSTQKVKRKDLLEWYENLQTQQV